MKYGNGKVSKYLKPVVKKTATNPVMVRYTRISRFVKKALAVSLLLSVGVTATAESDEPRSVSVYVCGEGISLPSVAKHMRRGADELTVYSGYCGSA